jgi:hypothetical protein
MNDEFFIPVHFNNQDYEFPAKLLQYGYSVKLEVEIESQTVLFEPDEERNWRAVIPYDEIPTARPLNGALLQAVAEGIAAITK